MKESRLPLETQARVIPADKRKAEQLVIVKLLDPPSLDELRAIVCPLIGADEIERVRVYTHFLAEGFERYLSMFVDESGGRKGLQPNPRATAIYHNNVLVHQRPKPNPADMPSIYGDAVLFRDEVWS